MLELNNLTFPSSWFRCFALLVVSRNPITRIHHCTPLVVVVVLLHLLPSCPFGVSWLFFVIDLSASSTGTKVNNKNSLGAFYLFVSRASAAGCNRP